MILRSHRQIIEDAGPGLARILLKKGRCDVREDYVRDWAVAGNIPVQVWPGFLRAGLATIDELVAGQIQDCIPNPSRRAPPLFMDGTPTTAAGSIEVGARRFLSAYDSRNPDYLGHAGQLLVAAVTLYAIVAGLPAASLLAADAVVNAKHAARGD